MTDRLTADDLYALATAVQEELMNEYPDEERIRHTEVIVSTHHVSYLRGRTWVYSNTMKLYIKGMKWLHIDAAEEIIRHEFSHIISFARNGTKGHGPDWKAVAREMGVVPRGTTTPENRVAATEARQDARRA